MPNPTFREQMDRAGLTPGRLRAEVKRLTGKDVRADTISNWRSGKYPPPPMAEAFVELWREMDITSRPQ